MGREADVWEAIPVHVRNDAACPYVTGWPNDEFAKRIATHHDDAMNLLCK
jgi:hypothetical protein